jgi:hypothetical protein
MFCWREFMNNKVTRTESCRTERLNSGFLYKKKGMLQLAVEKQCKFLFWATPNSFFHLLSHRSFKGGVK